MKKQILIAAMFMSSSVFACPMLQGNWTCTDSNGNNSTSSVTQQDIPNGVMYRVTGSDGQTEDIYADGVARPVQTNDYTGTMLASCSDSATLLSHLDFANASYGLVGKADVTVALQDANNFVMTIVGGYSLNGQPETSLNSVVNCRK